MLKFIEELTDGCTYRTFINLTNVNETGSSVAFKVKTTAPNCYTVKPSQGVLEQGQSCTVNINLALPPDQVKMADHKFQV